MSKYITCLLLALTLISTQSISTYAWFTDNENIKNDLVISMGKIDVEVSGGFYRDTMDEEERCITKEFEITNTGTLDQKLSLQFNKGELQNLRNKYTKRLDYKLEITNKDNKYTINFNPQDETKVDLKDENGNPIILSSGEKLYCKYIVKINKDTSNGAIKKMSNKSIHFNLNVLASQVNHPNIENLEFKHLGFTDEHTQANLIYTGSLGQNNSDINLDVEFEDDDTAIDIDIPEEEYEDKGWKLKEVDILGGTGEFHHVAIDINDNGTPDVDDDEFDIVKLPIGLEFNTNQIGNEFTDNQKLIVKLTFFDKKNVNNATKKLVEKWEIKFRINEDDEIEAYYTVLKSNETSISSQDIVPSEPEVVEPPKEEVEVPTEPEVVEPPKEEEVAIPTQLDIIQPPKEDEIEVEE